MHMTFVNMANKVISTVTIKPNENGQCIMNSTCHGGNPAHGHAVDAHGNPAQGSVMNMADCSFDTHWLVPGQTPKLNRNFVFADELVVPGGIQWRVGIQSVDPNVATYTYPHLANYPLNEAVQIEEADFVAKPGADCSFVGNRKLVVADMGHQFHSFQMIFKGKDLTIKGWDTLQKGGPMKGWSMDTTFDIKTCTAMVNLAPALPGPGIGGRGLNSIRKLTVSTNMHMTFVNMANKVISTVTIKPNENGQYIMNSTCHGGNPAHGHAVDAHGNPAQGSVMNMADCSFDTHWLVQIEEADFVAKP